MAPLALGLVPVALAVGALAEETGLPWWLAGVMSALVYAGPAQLLALQLIGVGASSATIVGATALSNLRYSLYGVTFAPHVTGLSLRRRLGLSFVLADGAFALTMLRISRKQPGDPVVYFLASVPLVVVPWTLLTIVGALAASRLPDLGDWGLSFASPAIFIALLVPLLRRRLDAGVAVVAGAIATAGVALLPPGVGVVLGIVAAAGLGAVVEWRRNA